MADITTEELEELENEVVSKDDNIKTMQEFVSPESLYQELIASVKKYHPSTDISLIEKAYKTADTAHKGQVRKSGEAYIIHPLCVAIILAELELDKETIVAGLLHDVVEDTVMTVEEIASELFRRDCPFGGWRYKAGSAVYYDADKVEVQAENLRKMFLAMAKDIRVILDQAGRPAAQYAYVEIYDTREAEGKSKRDHGHLCADCTASWYFQNQGRIR